jgi:hypothetical protein
MNPSAYDTDLDFVRYQLDRLAGVRSLSSLNRESELRYRELCDMERTILVLQGVLGLQPADVASH